MEGELFVVERYESDVEESSLSLSSNERSQVMIRLCDGSLEEIDDATGKVKDESFMAAS